MRTYVAWSRRPTASASPSTAATSKPTTSRLGRRRTTPVALTIAFALALVAPLVVAATTAPPAAAITVPPTVQATNWSTTPLVSPGATTSSFADHVSCSGSSMCMAVGAQGNSPATKTGLAEIWNGTTWSIVTTANPPSETNVYLASVSCVGPSFCMAVGSAVNASSDTVTLAEMWNGTSWSIVPTVNPTGTDDVLNHVDCTATNLCMAVGASGTTTTPTALVEQWTGGASTPWNTLPITAPTGTASVALQGITCYGTNWCLAVGSAGLTTPATVTVAYTWNGSAWTSVPPLNAGSGSTYSALAGVACAGQSFCEAVGQSIDSSMAQHNLIENWNGTTWTIATTPDNTHSGTVPDNELWDVSCVSATVCTAVGSAGTTTTAETTVLNWNGTAWSLGTTPSGTGTESALRSISCITNWACMATGFTETGAVEQPFGVTASVARSGYRFVASDGGVFNFGAGAPSLGSLGGMALNAPIVGMGVMPAGDGYYLVDANGGVYPFGSAQNYGSATNLHLNQPIVGMAVTPDGGGYWLVAGDGGVFSYGDAQFYGSTGNITLNKPIVGMVSTPDGKGYWFVASDGGVFSYGDAQFYGSTGNMTLNKPVVGMGVPTSGNGYYLVASDGGIFAFPTGPGGLPFYGSTGNIVLNKPVVGMAAVQGGYYLVASDGGIFAYPTGPGGLFFYGSTGNIVLNKPINGMTA
jgi:hypothetical protein